MYHVCICSRHQKGTLGLLFFLTTVAITDGGTVKPAPWTPLLAVLYIISARGDVIPH